jgi:acetyl esterase/lipase
MASWQSRVFNKLLYRLMRQRLAACESPLEMRRVIQNIDQFGALLDSVPSYEFISTSYADVPCDWIGTNPDATLPVILYFHGGGFCFSSPRIHGALLARLVEGCAGRGLMAHYRLAPEHPYPAAPDDCLAVYRTLIEEGISPKHIIIAGDSAGGNLTLVTLLRARQEGLPLPAAAVLLSPVSDLTMTGESAFLLRNDDPFFDLGSLMLMRNTYLQGHSPCDPLVSPCIAELHDLVPFLVIVGEIELLRDDSIRLANRLQEAGNSVQLTIGSGMPHVYPLFSQLKESRQSWQEIISFIRNQVSR